MSAVPVPSTLFMEITRQCNYRCRYCHMWTLRDEPGALSTAEKVCVLSSFAKLNRNGRVVFTGGEVMMKAEFLELVGAARMLGLESAANTNGSYIQPQHHEGLLRCGPDHLVFSLDSHSPAVHDRNRGVPGSFKATVSTISAVLRLRAQLSGSPLARIFTNSVLTSDNIGDILTFASFATDLGLDGCTFQVLSPTFHRKGHRDVFYERKFFPDRAGAIASLQALRNQLDRFPVVKTTDDDLRWMQSYIEHPDSLTEQICNSHERNIMVDHVGDVQLCFDMRKIFDGNSVGNVRSVALPEIWHGTVAAQARTIMKDCRRTCGMLNCHRRPTAL